jgi:crotonobetainyl-CoA:carnitine CoA-transferase CaiB-like acyl-CoA transferase
MMDAVVSLLSYQASAFLNSATVPRRLGNRHPTIAPYDTFRASDGDFFLAIGNDQQFARFCSAAGVDALAADERFATNPARVVNYDALRGAIAPVLRQRPRDEWTAALIAAGVPCGAVRDIPEVLADPQVAARQMIEAVEHVAAGTMRVLGVPIKLSRTPGAVRTAPPLLGQHTEAVLRELGLGAAEITALRSSQVI